MCEEGSGMRMLLVGGCGGSSLVACEGGGVSSCLKWNECV